MSFGLYTPTFLTVGLLRPLKPPTFILSISSPRTSEIAIACAMCKLDVRPKPKEFIVYKNITNM